MKNGMITLIREGQEDKN
uniref:Uncharacterized protein n=1 Tax=Arundo donax TaxID=35708 RepID=A0A0A8YUZ0_ARUDO